jgi:hypothetical protein
MNIHLMDDFNVVETEGDELVAFDVFILASFLWRTETQGGNHREVNESLMYIRTNFFAFGFSSLWQLGHHLRIRYLESFKQLGHDNRRHACLNCTKIIMSIILNAMNQSFNQAYFSSFHAVVQSPTSS